MRSKRRWLTICSMILFLISIRNIVSLTIPFVIDDEFCYWSIGAFFNNIDWSEVTKYNAYYNWGYGIILAMLIKVAPNMLIAYKIAILLNGLWMVCAFNCMVYVGEKLFLKKDSYKVVSLVAFMGCILPNVLVHTNLTWPECFNICLSWLIVYELIKFEIEGKKINIYYFNILLAVLYTIHQRFISILLAGIIIDIILILKKRIVYADFGMFIGIFVVSFIGNSIVKDILIEQLWKNSATIAGNNYSGQVEKIQRILFTKEGLISFFSRYVGALYAIGVETFLFAWWGILYTVIYVWKNWKNILDKKIDIYIFILVTTIFSIGISSIFLSTGERVDHLVYVRYINNIMQFLFLVGIIGCIQEPMGRKQIIITALMGVILIVTAYCLKNVVRVEKLSSFNMIANVWLKYFDSQRMTFLIPALIAIIIYCIYFVSKRLDNRYILGLAVGVCILSQSIVIKKTDDNILKQTKSDYILATSMIEKLGESNSDLLYLLEKNNIWKNRVKNAIQFLLENKKLYAITSGQVKTRFVNEAALLVWNDNEELYNILFNGAQADGEEWENEELIVLKNEEKLEEIKIPLNTMQLGDKSEFKNGEIVVNHSSEETNVVAFGPYISLDEGEYSISIELEAIDNSLELDSIGFIVIQGSDGEYNISEIKEGNLIDGLMRINFKLPKKDKNLEIAVYQHSGVRLHIKGLSISKAMEI